jgi:hypothetical protein
LRGICIELLFSGINSEIYGRAMHEPQHSQHQPNFATWQHRSANPLASTVDVFCSIMHYIGFVPEVTLHGSIAAHQAVLILTSGRKSARTVGGAFSDDRAKSLSGDPRCPR